jgi:hypothetical protein
MSQYLKRSLLLALMCAGFMHGAGMAATHEDICFHKQHGTAWGEGILLKSVVLTGEELNLRDGGLARFKPLTFYLAVLWKKEDVSVFELPRTAFGSVPAVPIEVKDQAGAVWRIQRTEVCE